MRSNAEYAAEEVDPEFAQSDAEVVAEAAGDAPAAEDTIPGDDAS